jgi:hypothetical protein
VSENVAYLACGVLVLAMLPYLYNQAIYVAYVFWWGDVNEHGELVDEHGNLVE